MVRTATPGDRAAAALHDPRATPDRRWIAALTGASPPQVEAALRLVDRRTPLEQSIHRRHLSGGRTWYAQIHAPLDLFCLARLLAPQHVVEVGVSSGVSSAHFLMGLGQRRSRLHSIDLPVVQTTKRLKKGETPVSVPPGRSSGWAIPDGLRRGWDLRLGPSQELLPTLVAELPRIDLFLHDDLHTPEHLAWELATIRPKLRRGSVVLADNSNWTGDSFAKFAETVGAPVEARRETDLLGLRMP